MSGLPQGMVGPSYTKHVDDNNNTTGVLNNPHITEEQIRAYIDAGMAFTAYINAANIVAGQAAGISLFANNISKKIVVFRVSSGAGTAGSNCKVARQATDFALGAGSAAAMNLNSGSANASAVTISSTTTGTSSGTFIDYTLLPAFITTEILQNSEVFIIPANTTEAIAFFTTLITTAGVGFVSVSWLEI